MDVPVGQGFTVSIPDPPGGLGGLVLGARVEVPYTHAIASAWVPGTFDPATGTWTATLDGVVAAGDYLLVWMTPDDPVTYREYVPLRADPAFALVGDVDFPIPDPEEITPDPDEVAALERTRLVDAGGKDSGSFGPNTTPTEAEVESLIDSARDMVLSALRPAFPASYYPQIRRAVALQAALLIEGSYHREQLNEGAASLWRTLLDSQLSGLADSIDKELQHQSLTRGLEPTPLPPMPAYDWSLH